MVFIPFGDFLFAGRILDVISDNAVNKVFDTNPIDKIRVSLVNKEANNLEIVITKMYNPK